MPLVRVLAPAALALLGATVGGCAVLVHGLWWGLPLALVATAACLVALPGGWLRRLPFAVGWLAALAVLSPARTEGDYLVAGDLPGYVLLLSGAVVLAAGVSGLTLPRRRDDAAEATTEGDLP